MPNVAGGGGLEGTASQSVENQRCNPTIPRLEGLSRDQHNMKALEGNIRDKLSLVGLHNLAPQKAQEIFSPLKPMPENSNPLVNPKAPSGPSQTKQPKGKANLKKIARDKGK